MGQSDADDASSRSQSSSSSSSSWWPSGTPSTVNSDDYESLAGLESGLATSDESEEVDEILAEAGVDEGEIPAVAAPAPATPPAPQPPAFRAAPALYNTVCTVVVPNGRISYYAGTGDYVAYCTRHGPSKNCRITRTSVQSQSRIAQGRPLGVLMAWLRHADRYDDAADPVDSHKKFWRGTHCAPPSWAERAAARDTLHADPASQGLFSRERPMREGELSEPDG